MEPRQEFVRFFNSNNNKKIEEEIRLKHSVPNKELKERKKHNVEIFKKIRKKKKA